MNTCRFNMFHYAHYMKVFAIKNGVDFGFLRARRALEGLARVVLERRFMAEEIDVERPVGVRTDGRQLTPHRVRIEHGARQRTQAAGRTHRANG